MASSSPLEAEYAQFRGQVEGELAKVERLIVDLEAQYIAAEHCQNGSVLRGFEGFLSSKETLRKRARSSKAEERLFSLSSKTSPLMRESEQLDLLESLPSGGFGKKGYANKGYANKGKR
uniref:Chromatin modification-related protein MEAF6 n=1 Tax=Chlamydomonas euryale TaxID=1486919 RepID=A0A7R9YY72_9CHLO|mmetsp:Transcript_32812/g.97777  ORF Transcript_32812/g.97777 Transcript_32812/m.97777 type:complete len:119 (+) Transcript_32812:188-544(+)